MGEKKIITELRLSNNCECKKCLQHKLLEDYLLAYSEQMNLVREKSISLVLSLINICFIHTHDIILASEI